MTTTFEQVLEDLEDEQAALERVLNALPVLAWDTPTHAPGWSVRDQVSHLAFFDEAAALAIHRPLAFMNDVKTSHERGSDPEARYLEHGRSLTPHGVRDWWRNASANLIAAARATDPNARLPWYGPPMSGISFLSARLMETWSHGLDIVDVTNVERPDTDRLRHVAFLGVRTRPFSYTNRGLPPNDAPIRVELVAPSGALWVMGEESGTDRISGTATDFCRVVTQRRNLADTGLRVEGPAAREWMNIAQAFAGPPGAGRKPGEFSTEQALA